MLTRIRQSLAPPHFEDEETTRIARLINTILLAMLVSVAVMQIGLLFTDLKPALILMMGGSATLLVFGLLLMVRRGHVRVASVLLASATSASFFLLTITLGLAAGLGILIVEVRGFLPSSLMTMSLPFAWIAMSLIFVVGATMLHLATAGVAEALARARRNERALKSANEALQREITERKHTEEALQENERRYRGIVEEASDPVYVADRQGRFSYVNVPAQKLSGWSEVELLGTHFSVLVSESWKKRVLQFYRRQVRDRAHDSMLELPITTKSGETKWVEQSVTLLTDDGQVTGFQSIVRDITERVRAEQALRKAHDELERRVEERTAELAIANTELSLEIFERARAEEALRTYTSELQARNEELDAYAHTVAHDLKGPIGVILGFAETLADDLDGIPHAQLRQHLSAIARNGRRMANITDELLLLASVREAKEVEFARLDMPDIIASVMDRMSDAIQGSQVELGLPDAWPSTVGHAPWVEEVWVNYMSNALKYGGQPPRVELGATAGPGDSVRFWVRDNGPGLTQEEQARLFRPFSRLDHTRAKGHGLGLSIVRRIVERLGGQVGVESHGDEGCTFFFTLPGAEP